MRVISMNKNIKSLWVCLFLVTFLCVEAYAATVKMRIVVANPSTTKNQTTAVKDYLPKEVTPKSIRDFGGLEIDYDQEQGLFYVYKDEVELTPGEVKTFELIFDDVWFIGEDKLQEFQKRTEFIMGHLKKSAYAVQAEAIAKTIYGRIDEIMISQNDVGVSKQQHIAYYRDNLKVVASIQADIEKLDKILVAVGGPPTPEVIEDSEVNLKSPNTKTTWVLIFIVLIFIAILGGSFYFIWMGQERITENIFRKEKDISYSDFKKGQDPDAGGGEAGGGNKQS